MAITRKQTRQSAVYPAKKSSESDTFDSSLRPQKLSEYVGQSNIKGHLLVHIEAAKKRSAPLGHTLLHGAPGLGKTTLAHILAHEMGAHIRLTSGPAIEKPGDLASLLSNVEQGDILFIDEIHRMRPAIEEVLYSAMEDYALDLVLGKGPTARSMRIALKPFTLVGATTKIGSVSAPLRDRFVQQFKLQFYTQEEMELIVERTAGLLNVSLQSGASKRIASCCRATPRIANRLMRSIRDFAQVEDESAITLERAEQTLQTLGIDASGLDATDRLILTTIIDKFAGGPVGLSTLAAATAEEQEALEDVYEPYLLQEGYLHRTPKGRCVTPAAYDIVGREVPSEVQMGF